MNCVILGCGFSGLEIGKRLFAQEIAVAGTTRSTTRMAALREAGIVPLPFDGEGLGTELMQALAEATHLVISIAPPREEATDGLAGFVDPVISALSRQSSDSFLPCLRWIGYLSTVGVYGDHGGAWIDEETRPQPGSARSRQRLRAEMEWQEFARSLDAPLSIFRLSGIYGPGRNALRSAQQGRSRRLIKKGQVFNRIHVEDIALAVSCAIEKNAAGIFNITDNLPAPPQDVVSFAHRLLGTEPPAEIAFERAQLSPMARSFYGENKRVSNALSKKQLDMQYQWPDYETALRRMFQDNNW